MSASDRTIRDIYFTSWRHVRNCGFNLRELSSAGSAGAWLCTTGLAYDDRGTATATDRTVREDTAILAVDLQKSIRFKSYAPHGIRLVAQQPSRVRFTDRLGMSTDSNPCPLTILFDEGKYKCWYTFLPEIPQDKRPYDYPWYGFNQYLCYAESEDGFNWTKPELGLVEYEGSRKNNILMTPHVLDNRPRGRFGAGVFVDPQGDGAERYKMAYFARFTEAEVAAYMRTHAGDEDVMAFADGYWGHKQGPAFGIAGAVSPDGIHWQPIDQPLLIHHSDTTVCASFDVELGKYVCYMRMWPKPFESPESPGVIGKRAVGRTVSSDFRNWGKPEVLIHAGADKMPSVLYYCSGHTWLPGCDTQQVMFVNRWIQDDDTMDLSLYSTPDGWSWSQVPQGEPIMPPGEIGTWDGCQVYGGAQLIELPGARWALPYQGFPTPHKYPRLDPRERVLHHGVAADRGYAIWPKGRLVALECPDEGEFSTVAVRPAGDRLYINASVEPAGYIKVGLRALADDAGPIPESADIAGRTTEDCDKIWGRNDLEIPVTWKGQETLNNHGRPVIVTFQLRRAKLFGLSFR